MKIYNKVHSNTAPKEIEINVTQVFIASNIQSQEIDNSIIYEYDLVVYNKDEYIEYLSNQNKQFLNELLDTQVALCEIYEAIGGLENG